MQKKGFSQIISTVLLITFVIVIAATIMIWSKGTAERITGGAITLQGKNIALTCNDIIFESSYTGGKLYLTNPGNILIYGIKFKTYLNDESFVTQNIKDLSQNWPKDGLKEGRTFSDNINFNTGFSSKVNKVVLIPVLLGKTSNGEEKEYICERESYILSIN